MTSARVPKTLEKEISVIVCTHNPRPSFLLRTLAGLRQQTFAKDRWELIVVDNASNTPVGIDPHDGRVIREERPGLTHARLCGMRHSVAPLLVFVDDDNVLAPDYLQRAIEILTAFPQIGVFGGQCIPEFEVPPAGWLRPFLGLLAIHEFDTDRWSNQRDFRAFPVGAGLCIKRDFALRYAEQLAADADRVNYGRVGTQLMSGEDTDMVMTCIESGAGAGRFTSMRLIHLIPRERLSAEYSRRIAFGTGYSLGRLSRQYEGTSAVRNAAQLLRTAVYLLAGKDRGPGRWVRAAYNWGYWKGLRAGAVGQVAKPTQHRQRVQGPVL